MEAHKALAKAGIAVLLLIPLWHMLVAEELYKTGEDFYFYAEGFGEREYLAPGANETREMQVITIITKRIVESRGDEARMAFEVESRELATGAPIFHASEVLDYNRRTFSFTKDGSAYNWFPRNVEKRAYEDVYYSSALPVADYEFEGVEEVEGLEAYVFGFEGRMDASGKYPDYPDARITRDMEGRIWVEPRTGSVVDVEVEWVAYMDAEGGPVVIDRGGTGYSDDTAAMLAEEASGRKNHMRFALIWMPLLFVFAAIAAFAASWLAKPGREGYGSR
ncbi:MAG: porin PorA family protein [Candidatus Micrarchaeota archaeon]